MSKLLDQILLYKSSEKEYDIDERIELENSFKKICRRRMSKFGTSFKEALDNINHL